MVNVVLNSIPTFILSFYKAQLKVLREITMLQSNFLWRGVGQKKSIHRVSWKKFCLAKYEGGLGVKNIELFNIYLLSKWKWRILHDKKTIQVGIINHRHRDPRLSLLSNSKSRGRKGYSIWWRDFIKLGFDSSFNKDYFADNLKCTLSNSNEIAFWSNNWMGSQNIKQIFRFCLLSLLCRKVVWLRCVIGVGKKQSK